MKKKFSTKWKASTQPRKQRKYLANAPLHIRRKFVSVNLSKDLRGKHGKRNLPVKKGDLVKVTKGKFKGKQGKVLEVKLKLGKLTVEGMQVKKQDNTKVNVKLQPANLQIIELVAGDGKRIKQTQTKSEKKEK